MSGTTPPTKSPLRSYFVTGLLIWVPLVITLWVINLIVSTMDQTLLLLPEQLQPEKLFGGHRVPGLIEWPARIRARTESDQLLSMVDVSATVFELSFPLSPPAREPRFSVSPRARSPASAISVANVWRTANGATA